MEICGFSLKNIGAFVAKIEVVDGDESNTRTMFMNDKDILLGQEQTLYLRDANISEGSIVRLKAYVVWGRSKISNKKFTYSSSSTNIIKYIISGTTLINELDKIDTD